MSKLQYPNWKQGLLAYDNQWFPLPNQEIEGGEITYDLMEDKATTYLND